MTATGVRTLIASVVLGTVLALPASASAVDTDNRCLVWADRYKLIEQTRFAVVFAKQRNGIETHYGCVFSREWAYALPASGFEFAELELFQLDGRFVAYAVQSRDEAVNETHGRIYVVDIKLGRTKVRESAWPDQTHPDVGFAERGYTDEVTSLVIKANGSVAWIARFDPIYTPDPDNFAVQKIGDDEDTGKQELDRGPDIAPASLAKARDGLTIYWTRGGTPKAASLR